jgi:psp operon transcriptional activator
VDVDVRIIGATNADLPEKAARGEFKRDLLDRLSFEVLFLPPLRHREEDILLLAHHFAGRMAYELGRDRVPEFTAGALRALEEYNWPGNIRELKNVVERAVYSADAGSIDRIVFNPFISPFPGSGEPLAGVRKEKVAEADAAVEPEAAELQLHEAVRRLEVSMIRRALAGSRYNQKATAARLGLSYDQLRGLLRKYGDQVLARE